ncbi:DUF4062 domain-containing protein [Desulfarculus baarsii]
MSYDAKVFNVMIASPSDVTEERDIACEIIHQWNVINSETRKIVLLPMRWETHSSPENGNRPQEIINKQLVTRSDMIVSIFWTRLGSSTGLYPSGTVEEIEEHRKANKLSILYFIERPVPKHLIESSQLYELKEYKNASFKKGLCRVVTERENFEKIFSSQLQLILNRHQSFVGQETPRPGDAPEAQEQPSLASHFSHEEWALLTTASRDNYGQIILADDFGGTYLICNEDELLNSKDGREIAKWKAALDRLISMGYLEKQIGQTGTTYNLTQRGYDAADGLPPNHA